MKNLVIIGAGPRGLAVALRASLHTEFKVTVIDEEPLSTWTFPRMLSDIQMRSPITFDLTTFHSDLKEYSLSYFLGYKFVTETQEQAEYSDIFCYRKDFVDYLKFIVEELKKNKVCFARQKVLDITDSTVECNSTKIEYDYLIMATGRKTQEVKLPSYLRNKKLIDVRNLHDVPWNNKPINVLGSGQQSAELVEFLARQKARVTWIQKHKPKIEQYPVPTMKQWGIRTALGSYYCDLSLNKPMYLKRVKQWGPSITPYIASKLEKVTYKVVLDPQSTNDINIESDFILATGFTQQIGLLPHTFNLDRNPYDVYLPKINKSFNSTSHLNVYFTGMLAVRYDGPRQGSIISSADTANNIIKNILSSR